jgi:hypothetical protein
MMRSVVQTLILRDWQRHWLFIVFSIAGGVLALSLVQIGGPVLTVAGSTWFFVSLIVFGSMLPVSNVINERKKQTLPFLMSLPLSAAQYAVAKLVSTFGMYLVPWLTLMVAAVSYVVGRQDMPNGLVPVVLILMGFTLVGFSITAAFALVSESEGWTVGATILVNSSYGLLWYILMRDPALRANFGSPVVVWSAPVLRVLAIEIAVLVLILGLTIYLQSRKRDFV